MDLIPCPRPVGGLEPAPRSALREDTPSERWEGFWSEVDERFYTCCTRDDGTVQWYRLTDADSDVLTFRARRAPATLTSRMVYVSATTGGRAMLVGTSRRRRAPRAGAGR